MYATQVQDKLPIVSIERLDSYTTCLIVHCADYEDYSKRLPRIVSYDNEMYCLTGWNSDRCIACYKNGTDVPTCTRY